MTQEVKVPVEVRAVPDEDLLACGSDLAPPVFVQDGRQWVLAEEQIPPFKLMIDGLTRCIRAWRAWSAPIPQE